MGLTTVQLAVVLALATTCYAQKNNNFAPGRNSIVQMFEWSWGDIANECEQFLGPKGFAGVQISPPSENIVIEDGRPWWERYQPISYSLNTRSGDEGALKDMISRCNNAGVRIYPDLVVNHMAATGGSGTDGNSCDPASRSYPAVPYGRDDFHPDCTINNFDDPVEARNCGLLGLPDLDQSKQYVRDKIVEYMNHLIGLGVAGFRVDAAKHMWPADLEAIFGSVNNLNSEFFPENSRPFFYQEVIDFGGGNIKREEYLGFGNVLEFKHGVELTKLFTGNNQLANLRNWGPEWGLMQGHDSVIFVDNHDTQRSGSGGIDVLTYKQPREYKLANAFMLAHPHGETTRLFSGYSFDNDQQGPPGNGWVNEHRWSQISNMVGFRNVVAGTELTNWWTDGNQQIAFSRGDKGFVAFSLSGDMNADIQTSLPAGSYCDIFSGDNSDNSCSGKVVTVDGSGMAHVEISGDDGALAIHVNAKL